MAGNGESRHRVVIVGGGFAGLNAARRLDDPRIELTLVDRRNFHLFQPLLYQVATGGLSPAEISAPLRAVLHRQKNTRMLLEEAADFDVAGRRGLLSRGSLPYDTLIVTAGSSHHYFGHQEWAERVPGLKTSRTRRRSGAASSGSSKRPSSWRETRSGVGSGYELGPELAQPPTLAVGGLGLGAGCGRAK